MLWSAALPTGKVRLFALHEGNTVIYSQSKGLTTHPSPFSSWCGQYLCYLPTLGSRHLSADPPTPPGHAIYPLIPRRHCLNWLVLLLLYHHFVHIIGYYCSPLGSSSGSLIILISLLISAFHITLLPHELAEYTYLSRPDAPGIVVSLWQNMSTY